MSIPDTSYLNTYLADTMTNGKAAADLVTGAMNPSSYTDPLLSSLGLDQLPNLDPTQVAKNLVGGLVPLNIIPFPIPDFGDIAGSIGDIVKLLTFFGGCFLIFFISGKDNGVTFVYLLIIFISSSESIF